VAYALPEEVRQAIDRLTDTDYYRLYQAARCYMGGTHYAAANDLVTEALAVAYNAACGGKGRRWKTEVPFMAYLCMTMSGITDDERRRVTLPTGSTDLDNTLYYAAPPLEQTLAAEEEDRRREQRDRERLKKLQDHFKHDKEVRWVIKGIMDDVPAREIIKRSGMTKTQYESAQRRWRRGVAVLFPGRRKK